MNLVASRENLSCDNNGIADNLMGLRSALDQELLNASYSASAPAHSQAFSPGLELLNQHTVPGTGQHSTDLGAAQGRALPRDFSLPNTTTLSTTMRTSSISQHGGSRSQDSSVHNADFGQTLMEGSAAEKPAKQPCTFFLRTGTCAYGDRCKFHHPQDCPPPTLNSRGYPLRSEEPDCAHYLKKGWCAFGLTCKFNHPDLAQIALAPYTIGLGTSALAGGMQLGQQTTYLNLSATPAAGATTHIAPANMLTFSPSGMTAAPMYYLPTTQITGLGAGPGSPAGMPMASFAAAQQPTASATYATLPGAQAGAMAYSTRQAGIASAGMMPTAGTGSGFGGALNLSAMAPVGYATMPGAGSLELQLQEQQQQQLMLQQAASSGTSYTTANLARAMQGLRLQNSGQRGGMLGMPK